MALPGIYSLFNERWCKQTVWIYSDPHFGDEDLDKGICGRPSDEEHIALINSCVGRKDTLIVLGDVGNIEVMKKVRGYKILICGNHDAGKSNYEEVFDEIYDGMLAVGPQIMLSHEPIPADVCRTLGVINFSGHNHKGPHHPNDYIYNFCSDVIGYKPVNLNQMLKKGIGLNKIASLHRTTIDKATKRKRKREKHD